VVEVEDDASVVPPLDEDVPDVPVDDDVPDVDDDEVVPLDEVVGQ